jgi:hypothetical protein
MSKEKTSEEEGLEIGRVLGAAARWGPKELIAELRSLSKKKKKKSYEIIAEALELYRFVEEMGNVDPRALAAAMFLIERHLELAIKLLASASSIFTSELVQSMLQAYNKIDEIRGQVPQPQPQLQPQPDIKATVLPLITQMLIQILTNLLASLTPQQVSPQQTPQKVKIIE